MKTLVEFRLKGGGTLTVLDVPGFHVEDVVGNGTLVGNCLEGIRDEPYGSTPAILRDGGELCELETEGASFGKVTGTGEGVAVFGFIRRDGETYFARWSGEDGAGTFTPTEAEKIRPTSAANDLVVGEIDGQTAGVWQDGKPRTLLELAGGNSCGWTRFLSARVREDGLVTGQGLHIDGEDLYHRGYLLHLDTPQEIVVLEPPEKCLRSFGSFFCGDRVVGLSYAYVGLTGAFNLHPTVWSLDGKREEVMEGGDGGFDADAKVAAASENVMAGSIGSVSLGGQGPFVRRWGGPVVNFFSMFTDDGSPEQPPGGADVRPAAFLPDGRLVFNTWRQSERKWFPAIMSIGELAACA